jgi:hypothetical protein
MSATLSQARFAAARRFVLDQGRPLDVALWRHRFEGAPPSTIIGELAAFQNPDGGFGHGLEPDIATPASTAIATSVGLRCLARAGATVDAAPVQRALHWLSGHVRDGVWPIIGPQVDEAPHAPWWSFSDDLAASWNGFRWNPTAEILAYLYDWRAAAPSGLLDAVETRMRRSIAETDLIDGAYDLRCAVILAEAPGAPADLRQTLPDLLVRSVTAHDAADEHAPALDLATSPKGVLAAALKDKLEPAAVTLLAGQQEDGGWIPFWDWAFVDEAAWARARKDWRGGLTRLAVEALAAHGRVEGL